MVLVNDLVPHGGLCGYYFIVKVLLSPKSRYVNEKCKPRVIFNQFESLEREESFVLVNDHDPKPLYYQFQAELTDQFTWEYLEQGPESWRVRIGRC
jgi:uncharacterized protein (DUF2249 family)